MATNPMKIRAANKDGVTEVKVLISHEMETGQRKDAAGAVIPAWFITDLSAKHNDKVVLTSEFGTSISKNPFLAFRFKGGAKGDKVSVSWKDRGDVEGQQGRDPHRRSRHRLMIAGSWAARRHKTAAADAGITSSRRRHDEK